MTTLILSDKNTDKKIITFTISKHIKQQLKNILLLSIKYNLRKKSQWVNESIIMLVAMPSYQDMIISAEGVNQDFVHDKVYMTFQERCEFAKIRNEVVRKSPEIRGPQASIIRAAILNRIMCEGIATA